MSSNSHIDLRVPRELASIVRNALENRASDFEKALPRGVDRPSNETEQAWKDNARGLRMLAGKLPRT